MRSALRSFVMSAVLLAAVLASACGGPARYTPTATSRAAGTDAAMSVERDEDQHTAEIELVVEHLAPPTRIQEGA
ncbi:MAG: hypothetical protein IT379_42740, partial [Deltaproteobacteria bacterium]|nr:hypothetical protein [Deltaproteobacteria bacterium]